MNISFWEEENADNWMWKNDLRVINLTDLEDQLSISLADLEDQPVNSSYEDIYDQSWYLHTSNIQMMSIIWYSVTLILGIIGNGIVIWIAGFKMKTISGVWLLNLAIANFLMCISLPFRISEWVLYWSIVYDHFLCKTGVTILHINMLASVFFMAIISIDRCASVLWPIWAKVHRTRKLACLASLLMWILSLVTSIPHLLYNYCFEGISECFPKQTDYYDNDKKIRRHMFIIRNICLFAFPFAVILICYTLMFFKIRTRARLKRSDKPLRVILSIVVSFFICWFPYNTWPLITLPDKFLNIDSAVAEIAVCLAYFSSCINPLIYVFFCHDFKKNFVKSLPAILEKAFNERCDPDCDENTKTLCTTLV